MSLTVKTKRWINKNCNISLKGKTVLVTGANSGVVLKQQKFLHILVQM